MPKMHRLEISSVSEELQNVKYTRPKILQYYKLLLFPFTFSHFYLTKLPFLSLADVTSSISSSTSSRVLHGRVTVNFSGGDDANPF